MFAPVLESQMAIQLYWDYQDNAESPDKRMPVDYRQYLFYLLLFHPRNYLYKLEFQVH